MSPEVQVNSTSDNIPAVAQPVTPEAQPVQAAQAQPAPEYDPTTSPLAGLMSVLGMQAQESAAQPVEQPAAAASESAQQPTEQPVVQPEQPVTPQQPTGQAQIETRLNEMHQQMAAILPLLQGLQRPAEQPPASQQPEQPAEPEQPAIKLLDSLSKEEREQLIESYYADPLKFQADREAQLLSAVEGLLNKALQPVMQQIQPVVKHHQQEIQTQSFAQQINDFALKNPDVHDVLPVVKNFFDSNPALGDAVASLPNAIEVAYSLGKAITPKTPEQLLQEQGFREKVMNDESIRQEMLKNYATAVKQGQPPVVIGNQPGAQPPAAAPIEVKTASEAKKAAIGFFQRFLGGA